MKALLAARDAKSPADEQPFLGVGKFAKALGVGEMTVYRAIHAGHLPAIKFGGRYVIPARALEELIEAAMTSGGLVDAAELVKLQGGVA